MKLPTTRWCKPPTAIFTARPHSPAGPSSESTRPANSPRYTFFARRRKCADGNSPDAPLVQAANGDLYGTTLVGRYSNPSYCETGCGVIFKITLSGIETWDRPWGRPSFSVVCSSRGPTVS